LKNNLSIRDIAKLSGVSVSTVSRVLNNNGRYSEATKEKVLKIAKENGYRPNSLARNLRKQASTFIGIIVPDISNEFFAKIVKDCEQLLFSIGYLAIVCNTERNPELEKRYIEKLSNHMVAGFIIISTNATTIRNLNLTLPIVYIDRTPNLGENSISVSSDNYLGGKIATKYLIRSNADPYMFITKTIKQSTTEDRISGFKDVLIKENIEGNRIFSLNTTSDCVFSDLREIRKYLDTLIEKRKKIGIFAINDKVAAAILKVAISKKIKIPEELSIIGFDDISISKTAAMPITTISQNTSSISSQAVNALFECLNKNIQISRKIVIPIELIKRATA
jgi:transcriptional regulator